MDDDNVMKRLTNALQSEEMQKKLREMQLRFMPTSEMTPEDVEKALRRRFNELIGTEQGSRIELVAVHPDSIREMTVSMVMPPEVKDLLFTKMGNLPAAIMPPIKIPMVKPENFSRSVEGIEPDEISGWISNENNGDDDYVVFVRQKDSKDYWDDKPLADLMREKYSNKLVTIHYWTCDRELPPEVLKTAALEHIFGITEADYQTHYSDTTGYLWLDQDIKIGGHDLLEELRSHAGKYLYMEIFVHEHPPIKAV
jgi:hypothetical protein